MMGQDYQKTQYLSDGGLMLGQCWDDVVDGGPTLTRHCVNVSCFLGTGTEERGQNEMK